MSKKRRKRRPRRPAPNPEPVQQAVEAPARPTPGRRRSSIDERPSAPWGSFPLVELVTLVALIMLVAGFFVEGNRGPLLIGTGLVLGSLAGLELAIREHLAGYRSHTMLLAGAVAVPVLGALFYLGPESLPPVGRVAVSAVAFGLAAWGLVTLFRRRSGRLVKLR